MSNLTGPRFESQTSCTRDKHITAQLTGWLFVAMSVAIENEKLFIEQFVAKL